MRAPSWTVRGLVFASVWAIAGEVRAEASVEERAVAADLFREATDAQERGAWKECEMALSDAVAMVETPGLRFHLAYCKEQQQRWVEALVDYQRAQEIIDTGVPAPDVAELLPDVLRRLEMELPRLTVTLADFPKETTLYVDGVRRSATLFGKSMPLDPGNRRVEVITPGYESFSSEVTLVPRERRELAVVLVPEATQEDSAPMPDKAQERDEPLIGARGWVLLSEGAVCLATLGLGINFTVDADQREHDRQTIAQAIDDPNACAGSNPDERCNLLQVATREGDESRTYATASYITSGVAAGALLATWLLWPEPAPVMLTADVDSAGAFVSVGARF
jgi:hypothetical protein